MSPQASYIVYAKRTAIGKFMGSFSQMPAPHLGAALVRDALHSCPLSPEAVDEIIMGQVLTAGVGQAPARQTAIFGGLPKSVCATTISRVCGSGIKAVMLADQAIRLGDSQLIFAGGQENMSLAPHLLMGSRAGYRLGNVTMKDHMQWDGLWDPYENVAMGQCGEVCAREYSFSRVEQDAFALASYEKAREANTSGHFAKEIVPIDIKTKKQQLVINQDEEPFSVDLQKLSSLPPVFDPQGTITAGNASSLNDGAALLVLASEQACKQYSLKPVAKIIAQASHAQDPSWFTTAPIACIKKLLSKSGFSLKDIDLFEINEAFAVVGLAALRELKLEPARVNAFGGAVALGHPIGASGARILATLIHGLQAKGLKRGLATLCIGGGEASGVLIERL